jgi:hypothetical protein
MSRRDDYGIDRLILKRRRDVGGGPPAMGAAERLRTLDILIDHVSEFAPGMSSDVTSVHASERSSTEESDADHAAPPRG